MTAKNEFDRKIFEDQRREIKKQENMRKAGHPDTNYGMRNLHQYSTQ